jgi:hypothetical protein
VHGFLDKRWGKAIPYGVYDVTQNCSWVSIGVDHDTAAFAVATLQLWWQRMGRMMYPQDQQLLMTADGGGSNGSRSRLWKVELQKWSDATGLEVWNKIEQRLFRHITETWRGRPLVSQEVIVNLIATTPTTAGLRVEAALDPTPYETGKKVSDDALAQVNIYPADVHGNAWNYLIKPNSQH